MSRERGSENAAGQAFVGFCPFFATSIRVNAGDKLTGRARSVASYVLRGTREANVGAASLECEPN